MKMICIGDSITTGYGVSRNNSWISILKNQLDMNILDRGINGDTTAGMLSRSFKDMVQENPDYAFIMGGCNDLMQGRSAKMVLENIIEIIREAIKYDIIPLIGIQPPIIEKLAKTYWASDINYMDINNRQKILRKGIMDFCTKKNLDYIDLFQSFSLKLKNYPDHELYMDGIHPSKSGHILIAKSIMEFFTHCR